MKFETWWKKRTSPELREDIEAYWGLTEETVKALAAEAGIENSMSERTELVVRSVKPAGMDPRVEQKLEFIFEWVDDENNETLFSRSLGVYDIRSENNIGYKKVAQ